MNIYINGSGLISPQKTYDNNTFPEEIALTNDKILRCIEPNYKEYISPVALRRMSRLHKFGVASAMICLKDANVASPDAIITGTGLGCMEETENFLLPMINNNETMLNPTPFIQSTHNSVNSQISILTKCHGPNITYVHRNISFESALLDSIMYLNSGESRNILAGGFDEMTEKHYTITGKTGLWKKEEISNLDLFNSGTPGTISGEGSGFFLLSNGRTEGTYCYIRNLKIEHRPDINSDKIIEDFCSESGIEKDEIDVVIHGLNGDSVNDKNYLDLIDNYFTKQINTCYKHLSGEWYTASVFAFWLGANIIRRQTIPEVVRMDYLAGDTPTDPLSGEGEMVGEVAREGENEREIKNLMIYHRGTDRNHSLILLTKC